MSQLSLKKIKLGDNADLSKNFVISVPAVADGTLTIKRENGTDVLTIDASGFMGVADGPKVKTKKFTGTTAAAINTKLAIHHGLPDVNKIIAIEGVVYTSKPELIPLNYWADPAQVVVAFADATNIYTRTGPSAGAAILNRPFKLLVTYEA